MDPVLTKKDFVRRYEQGEFGNRSPTWNTLKEFLRARRSRFELVHIRNRVAGGPTWYNIAAHDVEGIVSGITNGVSRAAKLEDLYFSLMAPTARTLFQGEVQHSCQHLCLYYSYVPKPMRQSLIEGGVHAEGLRAKLLLDWYLDTPSREWLDWLLLAYPGHVVEFSVYGVKWGSLPNRNTVIWEVRNY